MNAGIFISFEYFEPCGCSTVYFWTIWMLEELHFIIYLRLIQTLIWLNIIDYFRIITLLIFINTYVQEQICFQIWFHCVW